MESRAWNLPHKMVRWVLDIKWRITLHLGYIFQVFVSLCENKLLYTRHYWLFWVCVVLYSNIIWIAGNEFQKFSISIDSSRYLSSLLGKLWGDTHQSSISTQLSNVVSIFYTVFPNVAFWKSETHKEGKKKINREEYQNQLEGYRHG